MMKNKTARVPLFSFLIGPAIFASCFFIEPLALAQTPKRTPAPGARTIPNLNPEPTPAPKPKPTPKPSPTPEPEIESIAGDFVKSNIAISEWLDGVAEGIDLFITGKRVSKKENETRVTLQNSTISSEGAGINNLTHINVQLRLPNVEEYFQLKFSSYDEQEDRGVRRRYLRQDQRRQNYGATVGLFRRLGKIRTAFQPRVQFGKTLKVAHSISFESLLETKKASLNPKVEFFAHPEKGTGIFDSLNYNIALTKIWALTLINETEYDDKVNPHFTATNGLSFRQFVTERSSFNYSLIFSSNNSPNYHLDNYDISLGWNQLLFKQILDYQVVPHLTFSKERHFKGFAGITLNINLNF